jgi:hypothetical protein
VSIRTDNEDESHYYFTVQSSPHVIKLLQSIVQHSLECMKLNPEMMSYTLLACLRLLRVNLHQLITHERDLTKCFETAQLGKSAHTHTHSWYDTGH